jgi:hypothetical protein
VTRGSPAGSANSSATGTRLGFEIIDIPAGPAAQRAALAARYISSWLDLGRTGPAPE